MSEIYKNYALYACLIVFSIICLAFSLIGLIILFNLAKIKTNLKLAYLQSETLQKQILKAQKDLPNLDLNFVKIIMESGLLIKFVEIALLFTGGGFSKTKILNVFLKK